MRMLADDGSAPLRNGEMAVLEEEHGPERTHRGCYEMGRDVTGCVCEQEAMPAVGELEQLAFQVDLVASVAREETLVAHECRGAP